MSITINAFCLSHHLAELKKHSPKYLKMKIDELPGSTITRGGDYVSGSYVGKFTYNSSQVTFNSIDTIYHVLMKIDPINISLRQWIELLKLINVTPSNMNNTSEMLKRSIDIRNIDKHSAIIYKYVRHPGHDSSDPLCTMHLSSSHDYTQPNDGYYRRFIDRMVYFPDQYILNNQCGLYHTNEPININYTLSDYVNYIVLNVNAYEPSYIESLKRIHREMTDEPPIIGWDDDKLDYKYRTDDDSPFITKSELWDLIQKLERGEDILPKKRTPNPTPLKEIILPGPVKRSSKNMEPGRIRSKKSPKSSEIKEAIKETTGYINPYEGLDESSSSDDSIDATVETLEPKTKIDPKMLDCIAFDHEPVKPLRISYTAENINIFLVVYAFIMTALVTIGIARR